MSSRIRWLVCIAGATSGSTGLALDTVNGELVAIVHGRGLMPLELSPDDSYFRMLSLCNEISRRGGLQEGKEEVFLVCSLSGLAPLALLGRLVAGASESLLGPLSNDGFKWLKRGEACLFATGMISDAVVVKVGTVGFAHAFCCRRGKVIDDVRVGGWGFLSGDDGGGYSIGRHMLYNYFQELDGRRDASDLSRKLSLVLGGDNVYDATQWIQRQVNEGTLRHEVARLASIAVECAESQGADVYWSDLISSAAERAANSATVAVERAKRESPSFGRGGLRIILHGGILQNSSVFAHHFVKEVARNVNPYGIELAFELLLASPVTGCVRWWLSSVKGRAGQRWAAEWPLFASSDFASSWKKAVSDELTGAL